MSRQPALANPRELWDAAGPRMRQAVRVAATHDPDRPPLTAYRLAAIIGRNGNPRSGYPVVQRCLATGLLSAVEGPSRPGGHRRAVTVPPEVLQIID